MQNNPQINPVLHLSIRIGSAIVALPICSSDTDNSLIDRLLSMKEYKSICTHKQQYEEQYRSNIKRKIIQKLQNICSSKTGLKENVRKFLQQFLQLCSIQVGIRQNEMMGSQQEVEKKMCKKDISQLSISIGKKTIKKQYKYKTQQKKTINPQPILKSKTSNKSITKLSKLKQKIFNSKQDCLRAKSKKQGYINSKNKQNVNGSLTMAHRHKKMESQSKILQRIENKICYYEKVNKIYFKNQSNGLNRKRKESNISNFTEQMEQFGTIKSKQYNLVDKCDNSIAAIEPIMKPNENCLHTKNDNNKELKSVNISQSIINQNNVLNDSKLNENYHRQSSDNCSMMQISGSRRNSYNYSANHFGQYSQPQTFDGLRRNYNYQKQSQSKLAYFQQLQATDERQNRYNYLEQALCTAPKVKEKATGPILLHPYPVQVTSTSANKSAIRDNGYINIKSNINNINLPQKSARRSSHDFDCSFKQEQLDYGHHRKYEDKVVQRRGEGINNQVIGERSQRQLEDKYGRNGGLKFKYF